MYTTERLFTSRTRNTWSPFRRNLTPSLKTEKVEVDKATTDKSVAMTDQYANGPMAEGKEGLDEKNSENSKFKKQKS